MATPIIQLARNQALYMEYLLEKAKEIARQSKNLSFDPQGRVLVDITIDANDIISLKKLFENKDLKDSLGMTPTMTTVVSLDITDDLHDSFDKKISAALSTHNVEAQRIDAILRQIRKTPKGSIIALQQEFYFHLSLATRLYQMTFNPFFNKEDEMLAAYTAAIMKVNAHVMAAYAEALNNSFEDEEIDIIKLNKALDKARESLTPLAHTILMQEIIAHTGIILTDKDLKKAQSTLKQAAEERTATANDILHSDNAQGLITFIAGSENTAHHRAPGRQFAHRQIITHALNNNKVIAHKHPRIQIRTPSPVVKKGLEEAQYISDVAAKLAVITQDYALRTNLSGGHTKLKAFIYNRYTAIHDSLGDMNGNLQTQSTRHILQGAHDYNAQELKQYPQDSVFCFVQGISINGFGDTLGYKNKDPLIIESTLMAEMSLMHTLYETSSPSEQTKIATIFNHYENFLRSDPRPAFFSESIYGPHAIQLIQTVKDSWKNSKQTNNDFFIKTQLSLKKLIAYDQHFTHDYAKLIQSLSVLVEEASISGCKSGNERAQAINGRVAIMDAIINSPIEKLTPEGITIATILSKLAHGENTLNDAAELKLALDTAYNKLGLQSAASIVSLVDQGGPAKVESKPNHPFYISRNYAEEQSSIMTNLQQRYASSMQAHKDLPQQMISAWAGHPSSWWTHMKSSPLGTIGAVLGTIIIFPAIIVLIFNNVHNVLKQVATKKQNLSFAQSYHPQARSSFTITSSNQQMTNSMGTSISPQKLVTTPLEPNTESSQSEGLSPMPEDLEIRQLHFP